MGLLDTDIINGQLGHVEVHEQIATKLNRAYDAVADGGATGDGTTNDTDNVIAAIEDAGEFASVVFPPGVFMVDGDLNPLTGQTIHLMKGAEVKLRDGADAHVFAVGVSHVTFSGEGTINGNRANQTATDIYGIDFFDPLGGTLSNCKVKDIEIKECRDHGLRFGQCDRVAAFFVESHDNGTSTNAASGILCVQTGKARLIGNECYNMGIYGNPTLYDGDGIKIQDNSPPGGENHVVMGNYCYHNARRGIKIQSPRASVTGNVCDDNSSFGIGWTANGIVANGTCTGNICTNSPGGIQIDNLTGLTVSSNYCYGVGAAADQHGILVGADTNNLRVVDNEVANFGGHGIYFLGVTKGRISDNDIHDVGKALNARAGIFLASDTSGPTITSGVKVNGNEVYNTGGGTSTYYGIVFYQNVSGCDAHDNALLDGLTVPITFDATVVNCGRWNNRTSLTAVPVFHESGTGSPEGVLTAPIGATYQRRDGGAATSFYVKESGSGNTGWVAK